MFMMAEKLMELADEIALNRKNGFDHRFSDEEAALIEAALRSSAVGAGAREAFRAGWHINAATEQPNDYLAGCEEVDWHEYQKTLQSEPVQPAGKGEDDKEIGKQIGAYIGMSGIDADDVAYIRSLVIPVRPEAHEAEGITWRRVNDDPFEYAIQQVSYGNEFVKLLNGTCLRRPIRAS